MSNLDPIPFKNLPSEEAKIPDITLKDSSDDSPNSISSKKAKHPEPPDILERKEKPPASREQRSNIKIGRSVSLTPVGRQKKEDPEEKEHTTPSAKPKVAKKSPRQYVRS